MVLIIPVERISVNVIAVDDELVPFFKEEKRNLFGKIIPDLRYCINVSEGQHKITLLAERVVSLRIELPSPAYYVGECWIDLSKNQDYRTVIKRAGEGNRDEVVHLKEEGQEDPLRVCEIRRMGKSDLFEFTENMRQ